MSSSLSPSTDGHEIGELSEKDDVNSNCATVHVHEKQTTKQAMDSFNTTSDSIFNPHRNHPQHSSSYRATKIVLPSIPSSTPNPTSNPNPTYLHIPKSKRRTKSNTSDYISHNPTLQAHAKHLLSTKPIVSLESILSPTLTSTATSSSTAAVGTSISSRSHQDLSSIASTTYPSSSSLSSFTDASTTPTYPLLYVHQHEIGHATTHDYAYSSSNGEYQTPNLIIASDAATTCHIIAVRTVFMTDNGGSTDASANGSASPKGAGGNTHTSGVGEESEEGEGENVFALASLTHLDTVKTATCVKNLFALHGNTARQQVEQQRQEQQQKQQELQQQEQQYPQKQSEGRKSHDASNNQQDGVNSHQTNSFVSKCVMSIHIIGGYNDKDGTSLQITHHVFDIIDMISREYDDCLVVQLKTCITTGLNDIHGDTIDSLPSTIPGTDGRVPSSTPTTAKAMPKEGPILRGMAMNVSTGSIHFLSQVADSLHGPEAILRRVRSSECRDLLVIHPAQQERLLIPPFQYYSFPEIDFYLKMTDDMLLQSCSTSPECENSMFCEQIRRQFRFMKDVNMKSVFGQHMDCPVVYELKRVKNHASRWDVRGDGSIGAGGDYWEWRWTRKDFTPSKSMKKHIFGHCHT